MNGEAVHHILSHKTQLLADLCAKHGFEADRPLILCGFPPDQYEGADSSGFEFSDYSALIDAWMESFRRLGNRANVLIRPHPRIPRERFEGLDEFNVKFTHQPTAELIPLCDLYVASISATIRWAIACGIPVINYDTFRYRYGDYNSASGVVGVESLEEFRRAVELFVDDAAYAADLKKKQRKHAIR